jgi:hypothetical protein
MKKINFNQRAPLKHSRCLDNYTRNYSSMGETLGETLGEEVNCGSFDIDAIPHTDSDHAWNTHENNSSRLSDKGILITKITTI